jgi:uncharacterized protein (TIGR02246 family)
MHRNRFRLSLLCATRLTLLLLGFLLASGVHAQFIPGGGNREHSQALQGYRAKVKSEAESAVQQWAEAWARGDSAAITAMYTSDAVLVLGADEVLRGRSAIRERVGVWVQRMRAVRFRIEDFDMSAEIAYLTGRLAYDVPQAAGAIMKQSVVCSVVLRRQWDGSWQIRSQSIADATDGG